MKITLSSGVIEALKWFALLLMVGDHINLALFGRSLPILSEVARIVFPIFAIVLGYNLARPGVDPQKMLVKLAAFAFIAQPFHMLAFGIGIVPLNVLCTLLVAVMAIMWQSRGETRLALLVFAVGGIVVDYHWAGVAMVCTAWAFFRAPSTEGILLALVAAAGLYVTNGNFYALWAFPVVLLASRLNISLPRSPWAFYTFYPAHLLALAAWVALRH